MLYPGLFNLFLKALKIIKLFADCSINVCKRYLELCDMSWPSLKYQVKSKALSPPSSCSKYRLSKTSKAATLKRPTNCLGAAFVELVISFPVALLITLGTVHLGTVLREANVVVEASRHGARSTAALSGVNGPTATAIPSWVVQGATFTATCSDTSTISSIPNLGNRAAIVAACAYMQASGLLASEWQATSTIITVPALPPLPATPAVNVLVQPLNARGPVQSLKAWLNLRPQGNSIYLLEVLI